MSISIRNLMIFLLVVVTSLVPSALSKGGGVLNFEIVRYENRADRLDNGDNCEIFGGLCDPYFKICVASEHRQEACDLINARTEPFKEARVVEDSRHRGQLGNPRKKVLSDPIPRRVSIRVRVKDHDDVGSNPVISEWAEVVDVPNYPNNNITADQVPNIELKRSQWTQKRNVVKLIVKVFTVCKPNVYGRFCEIFCAPTEKFTCNNEGHKVCRQGRKGDNCDQVDHCVVSPCAEGAVCVERDNGRACYCQAGEGPECYPNFCNSNPCLNGGTCSPSNNTCLCMSPFYGPLCQHWKNLCLNDPCANNGTCLQNNGQVLCKCQPGFEGNHCETPVVATASGMVIAPQPVMEAQFSVMDRQWFWPVIVCISMLMFMLLLLTGILTLRRYANNKRKPELRPVILRQLNPDALNVYETPMLEAMEYNPYRVSSGLINAPANSAYCSTVSPTTSDSFRTYMPMTTLDNNIYVGDSVYDECGRENEYQMPQDPHYGTAEDLDSLREEEDRHPSDSVVRGLPLPPPPAVPPR